MIDATGRPQSVLVLGGSSEIAGAIVDRLVRARCTTVVLAGREGPSLEAAADRARNAGAEVVGTVMFDATDIAHHANFASAVFEKYGNFDVVLVAAGLLGDQPSLEADPTAAATLITTNFTGLATAILAVVSHLRRQGHGRLVILSSVAGIRARKANYTYGSSKAGLDAFSQGLGDALVGSGVTVTIVRPGFVVGRMTAGLTPAPFSTTPDDVAESVVRAVQTGAAVVYVPSILRLVFAAMRILPRSIWRRMPG